MWIRKPEPTKRGRKPLFFGLPACRALANPPSPTFLKRNFLQRGGIVTFSMATMCVMASTAI
ncbi:UNVERIFIED_CONTAM: hypothetical protein GTU68_060707 [Idotea baltica]|nr:hypothetical protein [Idotea baltica]